MLRIAGLALVLAASATAYAAQTTVCTVTVNSADEREVFRQSLPSDKYRFVELVERGRSDWLASACRQKVSCDVLVVSGHFAGSEFYSSKFDVAESLSVDEVERVACSDSCPDLFAHLKEVYLFGCDSLKPEPVRSATPEIVRGLVAAGQSRAEAERFARALSERHAESSRDRMRRVFPNTPAIYGFSSLAPYGRVAGPMLARHFQGNGGDDVGSGRVNPRLLAMFAPSSMVVTTGQREGEANADYRAEACRFYDDRLSTADRIRFMQELLGRDMPQVRVAFDRIEKFFGSLSAAQREEETTRAAGQALASDARTRSNYLAITRATQDPALRVRMIALARSIGWLTPAEHRAELVHSIHDVLTSDAMGFGEVDLVCTLNSDRTLDEALNRLQVVQPQAGGPQLVGAMPKTAQAAALACLGSADGHARMLKAIASANDADVQIAQAYLRHRPVTEGRELREIAQGIVRMKGAAQVRALETLARLHVTDREVLDELARLFRHSTSLQVQRAIAEVFIRAGSPAADPAFAAVFRQHRIKSPTGEDLIDVLIRRLPS
jgi:hypothetical protein